MFGNYYETKKSLINLLLSEHVSLEEEVIVETWKDLNGAILKKWYVNDEFILGSVTDLKGTTFYAKSKKNQCDL